MVIILGGAIGAGKDTVAKQLVAEFGFRTMAFAKKLKQLARLVFDYDEATLWGPSEARNAVDPRAATEAYWAEVHARLEDSVEILELVADLFADSDVTYERALEALVRLIDEDLRRQPALTCRYVLQRLGTEWGRALWPDVWLNGVGREVRAAPGDWAVTDGRFLNEADYGIAELGGRFVWVDASRRCPRKAEHKHASEPTPALFGDRIAAIVDNNADPAALLVRVRSLVHRLRNPKRPVT